MMPTIFVSIRVFGTVANESCAAESFAPNRAHDSSLPSERNLPTSATIVNIMRRQEKDETLAGLTGPPGESLEFVQQLGPRFVFDNLIGARALGAVYAANDQIFDREIRRWRSRARTRRPSPTGSLARRPAAPHRLLVSVRHIALVDADVEPVGCGLTDPAPVCVRCEIHHTVRVGQRDCGGFAAPSICVDANPGA